MRILWFGFKFLLSSTLVAAAVALLYATSRLRLEPMAIGIASVLLFFAAWPWVDHTAPNRALGLVGIMISFGIAFIAMRHLADETTFPLLCTGRRALLCHVDNLLHAMGGKLLAALPYALCALLLLGYSVRSLIRSHRRLKWRGSSDRFLSGG
jgi:hypothetical protein